jgi:outer membrane protein OmpA-like peptidoglycan-associated protein
MNTHIVQAVALALASMSLQATAQVKVFERPPTVEELRASMAAPAPTAVDDPGAVKKRGIVWNSPGTPAKASTEAAAQTAQGTVPGQQVATAAPSKGIALPIGFEPGSSRLANGATAYIEPIASLLRADPSLKMAIEGHTDASGSAQRNLMLSWDRAMTVFKLLVERYGIDPVRLQPVGKGSMELMDAGNPEGSANRRVQFRPLSAG